MAGTFFRNLFDLNIGFGINENDIFIDSEEINGVPTYQREIGKRIREDDETEQDAKRYCHRREDTTCDYVTRETILTLLECSTIDAVTKCINENNFNIREIWEIFEMACYTNSEIAIELLEKYAVEFLNIPNTERVRLAVDLFENKRFDISGEMFKIKFIVKCQPSKILFRFLDFSKDEINVTIIESIINNINFHIDIMDNTEISIYIITNFINTSVARKQSKYFNSEMICDLWNQLNEIHYAQFCYIPNPRKSIFLKCQDVAHLDIIPNQD